MCDSTMGPEIVRGMGRGIRTGARGRRGIERERERERERVSARKRGKREEGRSARREKDTEGRVSGDGGRILRSGGMKKRLCWQRGVATRERGWTQRGRVV